MERQPLKRLKNGIISLRIDPENKQDYRLYKFHQNNFRILIVAFFLVFEQLFFGFVVSDPQAPVRNVHFFSAAVMFLIAAFSLRLYRNRPKRINLGLELYEIFFSLFGISIALMRFIAFSEGEAHLPTIYIAVLYGVAVIFVYNLWQGILCYFSISIAAVILFPMFHPEVTAGRFAADIISNGIIAWGILLFNYRNFIISFQRMKEIEAKNLALVETNLEIAKMNESLREQSIHDELTCLYNRRKLNEVCEEVFLKAERYNIDFSLILIDIDFFKQINDTYGHDKGDVILIEFSNLLKNSVRDVDVCGRWGGEEFMVICQETDLRNAEQLAERLRTKVESFSFDGDLKLTASFGVSAHARGKALKTVIKEADIRLYTAKESGRNLVVSG